MGKTQVPPIWAQCRDKDGVGSGISCLYLWYTLIILLLKLYSILQGQSIELNIGKNEIMKHYLKLTLFLFL